MHILIRLLNYIVITCRLVQECDECIMCLSVFVVNPSANLCNSHSYQSQQNLLNNYVFFWDQQEQ